MVTESKRGFLSHTHNFPWRKAKGNLLKRKQLETRFISVFHVEINFLFSHHHLHTFPPAYIIFLHTFKRMYVTTYVLTSFPLLFSFVLFIYFVYLIHSSPSFTFAFLLLLFIHYYYYIRFLLTAFLTCCTTYFFSYENIYIVFYMRTCHMTAYIVGYASS